MAISDKKLAKIKADIEAGLKTKTEIANKHKINRLTLYNIIEREKLIYGVNKQKINEQVSQKSLEEIIEKEIDRATKITEQFLSDIESHRKLVLSVSSALASEIKKTNNNVSKDNADRIFSTAKINKIVAETLNICYSGARKALGMDLEADIEKARKVKSMDNNTAPPDPTEGMSEEEIDKKIGELE